jgi:hypothetical protein
LVPGRYEHNRDPQLAELLYHVAEEGWGNDSVGDLDQDGFHASLLIVEPAEQQELTEAFDRAIPAGNWILTQDQQGFITVDQYPTPTAARYAFDHLPDYGGPGESEDHRLGDEPVGAEDPGCLQQVGGAGGPQDVGLGHVAVAHRWLLERGELVDHRIGGELVDRGQQGAAVHRVGDDRLSAQAGEQLPLAWVPGKPVQVVAAFHQRPDQRTPMVPVAPATNTFILSPDFRIPGTGHPATPPLRWQPPPPTTPWTP